MLVGVGMWYPIYSTVYVDLIISFSNLHRVTLQAMMPSYWSINPTFLSLREHVKQKLAFLAGQSAKEAAKKCNFVY